MDYYNDLAIGTAQTIFVPLCGDSIDMAYLLEKGHSIMGNELSSIACEKFLSQTQRNYHKTSKHTFTIYHSNMLTLYCGDYFKLLPGWFEQAQIVYDHTALIALPSNQRPNYVDQMRRLAPNLSKLLLITLDFSADTTSAPYKCSPEEVAQLFAQHFTIDLIGTNRQSPLCQQLADRGDVIERLYLLKYKDIIN